MARSESLDALLQWRCNSNHMVTPCCCYKLPSTYVIPCVCVYCISCFDNELVVTPCLCAVTDPVRTVFVTGEYDDLVVDQYILRNKLATRDIEVVHLLCGCSYTLSSPTKYNVDYPHLNFMCGRTQQTMDECFICRERRGFVVRLDCGHQVCPDCYGKIHHCPYCRAEILLMSKQ